MRTLNLNLNDSWTSKSGEKNSTKPQTNKQPKQNQSHENNQIEYQKFHFSVAEISGMWETFSSGEQNFSYREKKEEEMQARLLIANWWGVKVEVSFHFFCSEDSNIYYQNTHEQQYKLLIFQGFFFF